MLKQQKQLRKNMMELFKEIRPQHPYTVADIVQYIKGILTFDPALSDIWVKGEISDLSRPYSGHLYFKIKEENSTINCVIFKHHAVNLENNPQNGDEVLIHGKVDIYPKNSTYQLIGDQLKPAGIGMMQLELERLKAKLGAEGLFDQEHKKAIPSFPKKIGVVTSATGAAIQDIIRVLSERYPIVEVLLFPTLVQGNEAPKQIATAIQIANQRSDLDLLIVGRGGGSIEELWSFNEESVARAIFSSQIPIISAVGHETDVTLADFVADYRAATPSSAAERAVPDQHNLQRKIRDQELRLLQDIRQVVKFLRTELQVFEHQIPAESQLNRINLLRQKVERIQLINRNAIQQQIHQLKDTVNLCQQKQVLLIRDLKQTKETILQVNTAKLNQLSPLETLKRGYSIASDINNKPITNASSVNVGDTVYIKLSQGELTSQIISKKEVEDG